MVNVALYTGLRLGEICNLRTQDIENVQGVACFHIRPHQEDGWSPKSAPGTRLVPIHSQLIKAGVMSFLKPDQNFLIPGPADIKRRCARSCVWAGFLKTEDEARPSRRDYIPQFPAHRLNETA